MVAILAGKHGGFLLQGVPINQGYMHIYIYTHIYMHIYIYIFVLLIHYLIINIFLGGLNGDPYFAKWTTCPLITALALSSGCTLQRLILSDLHLDLL